jgi:REP element-mobilizing transposase RayT
MLDAAHPTRLNRRPRLDAEVYAASGYALHLTIHTYRSLRLLPGRPDLAEAILAILREVAERSGVVMYCYCLMSTHLHVVVATQPGGKDVREFERFFRAKVTLALKG